MSDKDCIEPAVDAIDALSLGDGLNDKLKAEEDAHQLLQDVLQEKYKNICVVVGAGISIAAGMPDFRTNNSIFRSPGGIYEQAERGEFGAELTHPSLLFSIRFYINNPTPFTKFMNTYLTKPLKPTSTHYFIKHLNDRGMLKGCITQNFDALELDAGVPRKKLSQIHGTIKHARCILPGCETRYPIKHIINSPDVKRCDCDSLIKPDIIFFGQALRGAEVGKARTFKNECDCVVVIGTSLAVAPVCHFVENAPGPTTNTPLIPHILISPTLLCPAGIPVLVINLEPVKINRPDVRQIFADCQEVFKSYHAAMGEGDVETVM